MKYLKIRKVLEQINKEEEQKEVKRVKEAIKTSFEFYGDYTEITTKTEEQYRITKKLTPRQQKKPLKEQKQILINNIKKRYLKQLEKYITKIEAIEQAQNIKSFSICVDWSKGGTYGRQAKATLKEHTTDNENISYYNYFESNFTGGCGYDKTSTATATVLNQSKSILKLILNKLEKQPQKTIKKYLNTYDCREFLGYGLYLKYLSFFQGGVGFSSHENILNNLELKTVTSNYTKDSNFYYFEYAPKKRGGKRQ